MTERFPNVVTYPPGAKSPAHHHARSAFIYAYVPSDEKICTGNSVRYDRSK